MFKFVLVKDLLFSIQLNLPETVGKKWTAMNYRQVEETKMYSRCNKLPKQTNKQKIPQAFTLKPTAFGAQLQKKNTQPS